MKFKKTAIFLIAILTLSLLFSNFSSTTFVYASTIKNVSNKENFKIHNNEALNIYSEILSKNKKDKKINKDTLSNLTTNSKTILEDPYINEFEYLKLSVSEEGKDTDLIYSGGDSQIQSVIRYHKNTDTYSLVEANSNTGDLLYVVDDIPYKIVSEGENINMYSEDGKVLPLLITEYQNSSLITSSSPTSLSSTSNISPRLTFGPNYGPMKKTNKVLVDVVSDINVAASVIGIWHPILGVITVVVGVVTWALEKAYATLYIQYYQSICTTDSTYYRETDYYYQYSNYTGYVSSNVWYFYTSRPY